MESLASVGHWVADPNAHGIMWSSGLYALAGLTPGSVSDAEAGRSRILEEDMPSFLEARQKVDGAIVEYRWKHPDGTVHWLRSRMRRQNTVSGVTVDFGVVARSVELPQTGWLDFVDGFRYLWQAPFILAIALVKAAGSLVWGGINVLEVTYAGQVFPLSDSIFRQVFHIENGGTAALGMIYIVSGLGTGLGPLVMRRWLGDRRQRMLLGISLGFGLLVVGIVILVWSGTLPVYLTGTLVRTVGTGTVWVFSAALLQIMTPDRFRGRVFAFEFAALTLTQSVSTFFAGYAQDSLGMGVRQVTAVFAWLGVVIGLVWLFVYWRAHVAGWAESPAISGRSAGCCLSTAPEATTAATAPRAFAAAMNSCPSKFSPRKAKKRSPGKTLRLSVDTLSNGTFSAVAVPDIAREAAKRSIIMIRCSAQVGRPALGAPRRHPRRAGALRRFPDTAHAPCRQAE